MAPVTTAVVGCGVSGRHHHLPVLESLPNATVRAVCDADEELVESAAAEYGATPYTDVSELVTTERLDSVHICTPPGTHLPIAREVLQEDVPVLVEKPVATSTEDVDALEELSSETDTMVSVVHNQLFSSPMPKALDIVNTGTIGDVVSVTMLYSENRDLYETDRGDWVLDLPAGELGEGIAHPVYRALSFVDGLGEIRCSSKQNLAKYEDPIDFDGFAIEGVDRTGERSITFKVTASSIEQDLIHVQGTMGALAIDRMILGPIVNRTTDMSPATFGRQIVRYGVQATVNVAGNLRKFARQKFDRTKPGEVTGHRGMIQAYLLAVEKGGNPPVSLDEARDTVRVLEALE